MPILNHIENHQDLYLKLLEECVNIDSPSRNKNNDQFSRWFASQFEELTGGTVEIIKNEEFGNYLRCQIGSGDKQLMLSGHYDTVFPLGESAKRPFYIQDDKAFGPGVFDMKSGLIVGLLALKALVDEGEFPTDRSVVFFINSDEEVGSPQSRSWFENEANNFDAALVLECGNTLVTSRKGSLRYKLKVEGVSAHSSVPEKGVSAIEELSRQIIRLHAMNNKESGVTVNVGAIKGGMGPNTVASDAEALIDIRSNSLNDLEKIHAELESFEPFLEGAKLKFSGGINRPPMERTKEIEILYEQAKEIGNKLGMEIKEKASNGGSDGNFIASFGVPVIDGLGMRGGYAHSPKEFIYIHEAPKQTLFVANLIKNLEI
ncbi:M20 family metallopeptidase [Chengkuizengella axinellae]|uniref:M20 family metallopeptidase n=1 Tax=Chengkuizengella axinellae TaxID=3064388 RepID=A0ABT9ITH6_9BACL|nr:M20 family metallopeptidase [Chengkuizengella sp. 2205SS18-9]MDP5272661.1 M20 family metallopeptidase [Chengkuizengella sp. 2205SS18-9]